MRPVVDSKTTKNNDKYKINAYPNPVTNELSVEFDLSEKSQLSIYLVDNTGKTIKTYFSQKSYSSGWHKLHLETANLIPGIYHLVLFDTKRNYVERIIKN